MRDRAAAVALLAVLALSGCTASPAEVDRPTPRTLAPSADTGAASGPQRPVLDDPGSTAALVPERIVIPRIGVDASLLDLARDAEGVLAAPPADQLQKAGWYADGTVPGDVGPAVIAGHVDWVDRVAVFHRLGELRAGDQVRVVMSDRSVVRFTVDRTQAVPKLRFPTGAVYGPTPDAQLRVITCGGPWDDARDIYSENVIVYASRTA